MKAIELNKLAAVGLLGLGVLGALGTAQATGQGRLIQRHTVVTTRRTVTRPVIRADRRHWRYRRPGPRAFYPTLGAIAFYGTVVDDGNRNTFRVRADNGWTFTVLSSARVRRGDRVSISGYRRGALIEGATVRRF